MLGHDPTALSDPFESDLAPNPHWCLGTDTGFHDQFPTADL